MLRRRVRSWLAEKFVEAATLLLVDEETAREAATATRPSDDDEESSIGPGVVLGPAALEMLIEGEEHALAIEQRMATVAPAKEPEKPRAGSIQARIEAARRRTP